MIVVADTSPLNYLLLIGEVDVLPQLFGKIIIPPAVASEMQDPGAPAVIRNWVSQPPAWLEIQAASALDPTIHLGAGETEAISLAVEIGADEILTDDRQARSAAQLRGVNVAGTLNILEVAAIKGLLDLPSAITRLQKTNFRASAVLIQQFLDRDAKRRQQIN